MTVAADGDLVLTRWHSSRLLGTVVLQQGPINLGHIPDLPHGAVVREVQLHNFSEVWRQPLRR
ncbi:hypothetical protein BX283_0173 [Streptomyces sp. TLI_146]|nr:hypothetical protein BX283_0173 [Streptomyces sp. TLI_146]